MILYKNRVYLSRDLLLQHLEEDGVIDLFKKGKRMNDQINTIMSDLADKPVPQEQETTFVQTKEDVGEETVENQVDNRVV